MLVAQLSDTHFDGTTGRAERTRAVVRYLQAMARPADVVLVTGDIADHGLPAEYEHARQVLGGLRQPVLALPGNHDDRAAFRDFLATWPDPPRPEGAGADPVNQVHRLLGVTFALADSTIPGRDGGRLDEPTVAWLAGVVADLPAGEPLVVGFHHPPVDLGSELLDPIRQYGEDRLARVLAGWDGPTFLLCGHAHTPAVSTFAGRPLAVAPGVASTFRSGFDPDPDSVDPTAPPGFALHLLSADHRLTTHYRTLP